MKVYSTKTHEEIIDYIGNWYSGQTQPQPVVIYLDGENEKIWIKTACIGGGMSQREWHGEIISFKLPQRCYSEKEAEDIIEILEPTIKKLFESYESQQVDTYLQGNWDEDLIEKLQKEIEKGDFECELFFDVEGIMEEEKEAENVADF